MLVKVKTLADNGLYPAEDSVYLRYFWAMQSLVVMSKVKINQQSDLCGHLWVTKHDDQSEGS